MKTPYLFLSLLSLLLMGAAPSCDGSVSDSTYTYTSGDFPYDARIWTLQLTVQGAESLVRQTSPASGSGVAVGATGSASFTGERIEGKTLVRATLDSLEPASEEVNVGQTLILKFTDTKASMLRSGDKVTAKCRNNFEAVAPLRSGETLTDDALTWEFDYCRLTIPMVRE
jgi:hypothetical protein